MELLIKLKSMNKTLLLLFLLLAIGCSKKENNDFRILAKCDKIIIQDTVNNKKIHFLISFFNPSEREAMIFANSYGVSNKDKKNEFAGVCLKINSSDIPVSQPNSSTVFYIKPKDTIKMFFTYNQKYQNEELNFDDSKSFKNQLEKINLYYRYNKNLMDSILSIDKNVKSNIVTPISNFDIDKKKSLIEYRKQITIEDINKLIN